MTRQMSMSPQSDQRDDNEVSSHLIRPRRNEGSSNCQSTPPLPQRHLLTYSTYSMHTYILCTYVHAHTLEDGTLAPCHYQLDALQERSIGRTEDIGQHPLSLMRRVLRQADMDAESLFGTGIDLSLSSPSSLRQCLQLLST